MSLLAIISSRHRIVGFISLWETTGANETIQLPIVNLYKIDWGDGNITTTETSHEYATASQYTIKINESINDFAFNNLGDKIKILNVSNFGNLQISLASFYGCVNLDVTATDKPIVNSMGAVFRSCDSLVFNSSVSAWNVSSVLSFSEAFMDSSFNMPLVWDTSLANTMALMFRGASLFNSQLSFNTSLVTTFSEMFRDATLFNQPLLFDTANVLTMNVMFHNAHAFNQDISAWDTSKVTNMLWMFHTAHAFNQDISAWDYSKVTNISFFMHNKTSANYNDVYYDALLIKWDNAVGGLVFANMANVTISMGTIKYTVSGATAHSSLVSKGFIITDGGQV